MVITGAARNSIVQGKKSCLTYPSRVNKTVISNFDIAVVIRVAMVTLTAIN